MKRIKHTDCSGFTVIEVLTAGAIAAIIGTALAQMLTTSIKTQKRMDYREQLKEMRDTIQSAISDDNSWRLTVAAALAANPLDPALQCLNSGANSGCPAQNFVVNLPEIRNSLPVPGTIMRTWSLVQPSRGFTFDPDAASTATGYKWALCNTFNGLAGSNSCPFRMAASVRVSCQNWNSGTGQCAPYIRYLTTNINYQPATMMRDRIGPIKLASFEGHDQVTTGLQTQFQQICIGFNGVYSAGPPEECHLKNAPTDTVPSSIPNCAPGEFLSRVAPNVFKCIERFDTPVNNCTTAGANFGVTGLFGIGPTCQNFALGNQFCVGKVLRGIKIDGTLDCVDTPVCNGTGQALQWDGNAFQCKTIQTRYPLWGTWTRDGDVNDWDGAYRTAAARCPNGGSADRWIPIGGSCQCGTSEMNDCSAYAESGVVGWKVTCSVSAETAVNVLCIERDMNDHP